MRLTVSNLAVLVLAAGANAQLNKLAQAAGKKYFGSATDNGELDDADLVAILSDTDEFGQVTPGNTQKWQYTEPEQGTFSYTEGDEIVTFAQNNNQILRCHNLVWYNQLPSWVSSGTWTNATLTDALTTHITNEVTHYQGECYAWDVVNEALDDSGGYRDNIFFQTIGEAYIPIAFAAAAAADPDAKLYYNDYSIEFTGTKTTEALAIVDLIQASGAQIDGVGLQGHFIVGQVGTADNLASVLEQFVAKGVEVAYTEVDVRHSSVPASDDAVEQQAQDYAAVVSACLQVEGCVGITVWDFDDKYSWVPSTFSGAGEACLYDENLAKKPAWTSVSSVLAAAGTGAATATAAGNAVVSASATPTGAPVVASSASGASAVVAASTGSSANVAAGAAGAATSSAPAVLASSSAGTCVKKTKTVYTTL